MKELQGRILRNLMGHKNETIIKDDLHTLFKMQQQHYIHLITALEWYANNKNWGTFEEYGLDIGDGGEHARSVLQQIQAEDDRP